MNGSDANSISGGDGADVIYSGGGDDTVSGDGGSDSIFAGAGNDTVIGGANADSLNGGAGTGDWADYSGSAAGVTVFLNGSKGSGGDALGDVLTQVENLVGSDFNDILIGDAAANTLQGGDGIDVLQGGAGADVLDGGASLDWAGYFDATGPLVIDLATPANSSAYFAEDTLISIEIIGGASNFSNTFQGNAAPNIFIGGSENDTIAGGGGGDLLQGGGGNDTIMGEAGTDAVMGNKGDDILYGGTQADGFLFPGQRRRRRDLGLRYRGGQVRFHLRELQRHRRSELLRRCGRRDHHLWQRHDPGRGRGPSRHRQRRHALPVVLRAPPTRALRRRHLSQYWSANWPGACGPVSTRSAASARSRHAAARR